MIKVGDWVKESPNSADYIRVSQLDEGSSKGLGYAYRHYNRYAYQVEIDIRYVVKISSDDMLEKLFDEIMELRSDFRELKDKVDSL